MKSRREGARSAASTGRLGRARARRAQRVLSDRRRISLERLRADRIATAKSSDIPDLFVNASAHRGIEAETTGPFDVRDAPAGEPMLDLGGIRLPAIPGLQLAMEQDASTGEIVAVSIDLPHENSARTSSLWVQACAAPRRTPLWEQTICKGIFEKVRADGGRARILQGHFGPEVLAEVDTSGRHSHSQPARFLGVDGPRWLLQVTIFGTSVANRDAMADCVDLIRRIVVVRGTSPMPSRAPIPLKAPLVSEAPGAPTTAPAGPLGPSKP